MSGQIAFGISVVLLIVESHFKVLVVLAHSILLVGRDAACEHDLCQRYSGRYS